MRSLLKIFIILAVCLSPIVAGGVILDTSTSTGGWTQFDSAAVLGDQKWRRHFAEIPSISRAYQYKAIETTGNFTHTFDYTFSDVSGAGCGTMIYALSDTHDTYKEIYNDADAHCITIRAIDNYPSTVTHPVTAQSSSVMSSKLGIVSISPLPEASKIYGYVCALFSVSVVEYNNSVLPASR